MAYDYSSESKLLELPNPYRLQNSLLWLCAALLVAAGVTSLYWARDALQGASLRLAAAPLLAGLAMLAAGLGAAAAAARRLRFFFGRGRPASLAPEIPPGAYGGSKAADQVKDMLRQGGLTYPEPKGAIEGLLYHWAPTLITAPLVVQSLAQRTMFNLAALLVTLLSFALSWLLFGNDTTRPWIGILYFVFGALFILKPVLGDGRARLSALSVVALIAAAILAPVLVGLVRDKLPPLGSFSLSLQTTLMLVTALVACGLAMMAVLAQVSSAPQTRASVDQTRLSMNAPPASLLDELDRTLQSEWTDRIPNRRYARLEPEVQAQTPSGSFAGELLEETQPMPVTGTQGPSFGAALAAPRHRALLLLDLFATGLTLTAIACVLRFVRDFDVMAVEANRCSLLGTSAILGLVAAFCFKSAAGLWGRFDFHSVLTWVEMIGNYQTSRIGTGNQFSSRMNTQNDIVRTEAMTLRVWRARIESVVFGKDEVRQVTAMFSTEAEAQALSQHLSQFARSQSVLVAPGAAEDGVRLGLLNAGERALAGPGDAASAEQLHHELARSRLAASAGGAAAPAAAPAMRRFCTACGTAAAPEARFCSQCAQPLSA
jgi:hypothetical protein